MITNNIVNKITQYLEEQGIRIGAKDERPWGSWDLMIYVPNQQGILLTNRTFGWGYTIEQGFCTFLENIINENDTSQVKDLFVKYIGQERMDVLINIFNSPEPSTSLIKA